MAVVSSALRGFVTQRAKGQCEYCQAQQEIVIKLVVDHIVPRSAGGPSTAENLCLACSGCNSYKWEFQTGNDPETAKEEPLFNPRVDLWEQHFRWDEDSITLVGLTSIGRATIFRLNMNREDVLIVRRRWASVGWHPPKS